MTNPKNDEQTVSNPKERFETEIPDQQKDSQVVRHDSTIGQTLYPMQGIKYFLYDDYWTS